MNNGSTRLTSHSPSGWQSHGFYSTRDIYLAAFLIFNQARLIKLEPRENIVWFYFEDSPRITEMALKYFDRSAKVEPMGYNDIIRNLRHMVKDILNSRR